MKTPQSHFLSLPPPPAIPQPYPASTELSRKEHTNSTQMLLENSVCFTVGFMAANLVILEAAFEEKTETSRFCVVDFEIG